MSRVITAVTPVTLFGQPVPAFANHRLVKSGDFTAAMVKVRDGGKFSTVEGKLSTAERSRISARLRAAAK